VAPIRKRPEIVLRTAGKDVVASIQVRANDSPHALWTAYQVGTDNVVTLRYCLIQNSERFVRSMKAVTIEWRLKDFAVLPSPLRCIPVGAGHGGIRRRPRRRWRIGFEDVGQHLWAVGGHFLECSQVPEREELFAQGQLVRPEQSRSELLQSRFVERAGAVSNHASREGFGAHGEPQVAIALRFAALVAGESDVFHDGRGHRAVAHIIEGGFGVSRPDDLGEKALWIREPQVGASLLQEQLAVNVVEAGMATFFPFRSAKLVTRLSRRTTRQA